MDLTEDLSSPTILAAPKREVSEKLMTDASDSDIGGVLLQQDGRNS